MDEALKSKIDEFVKTNDIYLFMKGSPDAPQCGFSAQASMILKEYNKPFATFDVLSDDDVRNGIKEYSDWPTIPQLYIKGEFVGGCDILTEMHNNGDLAKILDTIN